MLRRTVESDIEIDASPERVWNVLSDLPRHADWDPFIRRIEGDLRQGGRLKVVLRLPDGRGMVLRPKVLTADPGRQLRWLGHLGFPYLFDGEHSWTIEPLGDGKVRLVQQLSYSSLPWPVGVCREADC